MTEVPKPLDAALDLFVYAPVGLAITAADEVPKLAAKGRSKVQTQIMMARVVGQFALARGRQELEKRFGPPARPAGAPPAAPEGSATVTPMPPRPPAPAPATFEEMTANGAAVPDPAAPPPAAGDRVAAPAPTGSAPSAGQLAIPGYDSLSASQVVQRLAGLSPDERGSVGAYERAHRGRRTILHRIDQLQGH